MKKKLAYAGALLALLVGASLAPQPASAQLGSLLVNITAPSSGATVNGTVEVRASVTIIGLIAVGGVQFQVDGANIGGEDGSAPYSVSWNTTGVANGSHTLTAVARSTLGLRFTSNPVTVTVNNGPPPDTTPPSVSITSPANGATVSGTITVAASASDNVGVAGVQFFLDGVLGADDTGAPYSTPWDTTGAANGSHTITAVARDAAGNTRTSAAVTVTVNNGPPPDTTPPSAAITSPANGATVSGTITVAASASDNVGVVSVQFFRDGVLTGTDTSAPYSLAWNTIGTPNGSHTLTVVARDAAGNSTTSASVTVTVSNGSAAPLTRFEENHAAVSSGPAGAWVQQGQDVGSFSGGAAVSSNVAGAVASLTFTGKAVSLIGLKCNVCGIATVSIDGGAPVTVDTAGPAGPNPKLKSETVFAASLADGTHTLTITVTGTSTSGGSHVIVDAFDVAGPSASPIVVENLFPGSENWQMQRSGFQTAEDVGKQIKGYASATSVNKGESITFHVAVTPAQQYTMDVYRMGWYQGLGGRLLQRIGPLQGALQPACPVDTATGLIECAWTPGHTLTVPQTWTSGVYLVQLTNALGYQTYITFVVRDDARRPDILYQQSVTTYQAYNNYPDDGVTGKSLYDFNSYGANVSENTGTPRAVKVSWNRPYAGDGSGHFLNWEYFFVRWLERSGYDVTYSTNIDTHRNSARLLNSKAFLSVGHDEYWSKAMYDGVEQARDAGVSLGFFGGDAVFWQVRFEPSPTSGAADRVLVGYKNRSLDPVQGPTTTVLWRDPFLNRPEQRLVGVQFSGQVNTNVPYVVTNSSSWVYQGTGLVNGNSIPGIVGYEADSAMPDAPLPNAVPGTYQILSQSPYQDVAGPNLIANSSIYQAPSGAWVFGAGTISWSWGLDLPGVADPRIQRTTENLLNRFLGIPLQP